MPSEGEVSDHNFKILVKSVNGGTTGINNRDNSYNKYYYLFK